MCVVSVLISAYEADGFIASAMESVLKQSFTDFELLVIDDGSSDQTYEKIKQIKDPRIKTFRQDNSGKAVAINKLLDVSKGRLVTILDADDAMPANRLEVLVKAFEQQPDVLMIQTGYALILNDVICAPRRNEKTEQDCANHIRDYLMPGLDPTMMVQGDVARKVKFDPELRIGQGFDFILKVGELGKVIAIPDILYYYRFHYASVTKKNVARRAMFILKVINNARSRRGEALMAEDEFARNNKKLFSDKDNNLCGHLTDSVFISVSRGERKEAFHTAWIAARYFFGGDFIYVKPVIYSVLPVFINKMIRNSKFGSNK